MAAVWCGTDGDPERVPRRMCLLMDDDLRRRADANVASMRSDRTSDWPSRLVSDLADAPLADPDRIPAAARWAAPDASLAPPEVRVLQAAAAGLTSKMTADLLTLSRHTILTHRRAAIYKLRAKNMPHAVAVAMRNGIIT